jgi:hypothetical protein
MAAKLCAVSVDLDELPNYFNIHGLPVEPGVAHLVYDVGLARLGDFASALRVPMSLFAIGEDLARPASASALRALHAAGHAIENHSLSHRYDLSRLGPRTIADEIEGGARAIANAVGERPEGFRAPGYTVSDALFDALEDARIVFDSSVFPCPPYYAAKIAVLASMRVLGKKSASIADTPRVLIAPTSPYRPGRPWWRRGARSFVEQPIQVTPRARLPFIGTSVALAGPTIARMLGRSLARETFVTLELHGIDFLAREDGLETLARRQRELQTPLSARLDALTAAIETLRNAGFSFVLHREAAREHQRSL